MAKTGRTTERRRAGGKADGGKKAVSFVDMRIHRPDEADDAGNDIYSLRRRAAPSRVTAPAVDSDSDSTNEEEQHGPSGSSSEASDSDADHADVVGEAKPVSSSKLAFLAGLERNQSLNVSQKDAKLKAKQLKRNDRKEIEQLRKDQAADAKRLALASLEEDDEVSSDSLDDDDQEEEEEVKPTRNRAGEKVNYQEYSDVSEGEDVESSSSSSSSVATRPVVGEKRKAVDGQDAESVYLARLGKRREREFHLEQQERAQRLQAKLPVRKLDNDAALSSDSDEDHASDLDDVSASDEEEAQNRAVHKPLSVRADSPETVQAAQAAAQEAAARRAAAEPRTSITHSSRFNLTAPYDILLTAHPCRLSVQRLSPKAQKAALAAAKTQTVLLARNQIASLASQIIADPEVNIGFLKRLLVFAAPMVQAPPEKIPEIRLEQQAYKANPVDTPPRPIKVEVDAAIRQLTILSLLAVFIDILPGYRIRNLSESEAAEKVGQDVARRREFEASLVSTYREYLELCEAELKGSLSHRSRQATQATAPTTALQSSVVRVFTTLGVRATHFNYRQNILSVLVSRMSRRTWGQEERDCFEAVQTVVKDDRQGDVSLEVVRLVHRMTKERKYKVNSKVLDILLDLRLRNELGNKRASTTHSTDPDKEAAKARREAQERRAAMKAREAQHKAGKNKATPQQVRKGLGQHLSKKQVKAQRDLRAIRDEMKEAEATIDLEERERSQTETLKLVFVLYFTILKMPAVGRHGGVSLGVLESALRGLSLYAHRVNVDFFRDLLKVLRQHVSLNAASLDTSDADVQSEDDQSDNTDDEDGQDAAENILLDQSTLTRTIRHIILALKTTFDLFLGQPETSMLNLDLTDLLSHFYYVLFYIPFISEAHLLTTTTATAPSRSVGSGSNAVTRAGATSVETGLLDLALDSLHAILVRSRTRFDASVLSSFAKRLCIIALHVSGNPPALCKLLALVGQLLATPSTASSDSSQTALLDLQDKSRNGAYDALGKNLSTSQVLSSGQSIVWELALLSTTPHDQVQQAVAKIWALAHETTH